MSQSIIPHVPCFGHVPDAPFLVLTPHSAHWSPARLRQIHNADGSFLSDAFRSAPCSGTCTAPPPERSSHSHVQGWPSHWLLHVLTLSLTSAWQVLGSVPIGQQQYCQMSRQPLNASPKWMVCPPRTTRTCLPFWALQYSQFICPSVTWASTASYSESH